MQFHATVRPPLALFSAIILFACSGDSTPTGGGNGTTPTGNVSVVDNAFVPAASTIGVGQTLTWTWAGNNLHDVTFDDASIGNSPTQTEGTFQKTFTAAGEFTYYCTIHSRAVMSGRVTVSSSGG